MWRGSLKFARRVRQWATSSSAVRVAPGLRVTKALGTSPHFSSGTAMTAHSITAGWETTACSTSMVEMFSPPLMMMSFMRSRSSMEPSGWLTPRSPEWNQPPLKALAVASASL